jgi:hypothetical protein
MDIAARKSGALMLQTLGPGHHRFDPVALLVVIAAVVFASTLFVGGADGGDVATPLVMVVGTVCMATATTFSAGRFASSIPNGGVEQTLFRLTPAAPSAPELNRALARQLLGIGLGAWALGTALLLAMSAFFAAPAIVLGRELVAMCGVLAMAAWPLRDYASVALPDYARAAALGVLLPGWAVATAVMLGQGALWMAMLALLLAVSAWSIHAQWRAMLRAPVAFPAGRMVTL